MPANYGHHRSDRIFEVLQPVAGIRDEMARRGVKPHDHARDNKLRIKTLQKLNLERREAVAAAAAVAAAPKRVSPKYAGIGSRVAVELSRPATPAARPATAPEPRNFACPRASGPPGRVMTVWAPPPLLREGAPEAPHREKRKPPVPLRQSASHPPKSDVDFVKRNSELSSLTPRKAATVGAGVPKGTAPMGSPATSERSKHHGRVPPYLLDRKLELAQKAAAAAAASAPRECPEGTHFLPEEERLRVLDLIADGQRKVHDELDAMPFVVDTFGLRHKHEVLTQQLAQVDDFFSIHLHLHRPVTWVSACHVPVASPWPPVTSGRLHAPFCTFASPAQCCRDRLQTLQGDRRRRKQGAGRFAACASGRQHGARSAADGSGATAARGAAGGHRPLRR